VVTALACGLLIGIERGWKLKDQKPGTRVAGVRTFAMLGMGSGIAGLVGLTIQCGLPIDYWSSYANQVTSIDAATATAKAKQIIHPDNLLIVVVGDRAKIEDGIRLELTVR
jgi:uncharacterized membrane protein YhiD involved in acid resistance